MIIYAVASILLAITGVFPTRMINTVWAMIFYALIGIAVGADVPTSWSLISEFAPKRSRGGRLFSITNVMWYVGVLIELGISIALVNTGMVLFRVIWILLGLVAIFSWFMRRRLAESPRFQIMKGENEEVRNTLKQLGINATGAERKESYSRHQYVELFTKYGSFVAFAWFLYLMWGGIPASTYGEFFPYIFNSLHLVSARATFAFEAIYFGSAIVPGLLIFYFLSDRLNVGRVPLYLISAAMSMVSFYLLVYPPFLRNVAVLLVSFLLFGIGQGGLGVWPITRLLSIEHFPTSIRDSGQGFVWFTMRFEAGIFGLFTPLIVGANGQHVEYIGWIAGGTFFLLALIVVGGVMSRVAPFYVKTEADPSRRPPGTVRW